VLIGESGRDVRRIPAGCDKGKADSGADRQLGNGAGGRVGRARRALGAASQRGCEVTHYRSAATGVPSHGRGSGGAEWGREAGSGAGRGGRVYNQ
jgi:hypothetical protein